MGVSPTQFHIAAASQRLDDGHSEPPIGALRGDAGLYRRMHARQAFVLAVQQQMRFAVCIQSVRVDTDSKEDIIC